MGAGGEAGIFDKSCKGGFETSPDDAAEPILRDNPSRFCMRPIRYPEVWAMYKKAEASFWTGE